MRLFRRGTGSAGDPIAALHLDRSMRRRLHAFAARAEAGALAGKDLAEAFRLEVDDHRAPRDERALAQIGAAALFPGDLSLDRGLETVLLDLAISPTDDFDDPRGVARRAHPALVAILVARLDLAGRAEGDLTYGGILGEAVAVSPPGLDDRGPSDHLPSVFATGTPAAESIRQRWMLRSAGWLAGRVHTLAPLPDDLIARLREVVAGRDVADVSPELEVLLGTRATAWNDMVQPYWRR